MNVIARLEYELAYYDSAVHRFNHYTTGTPPKEEMGKSMKPRSQILTCHIIYIYIYIYICVCVCVCVCALDSRFKTSNTHLKSCSRPFFLWQHTATSYKAIDKVFLSCYTFGRVIKTCCQNMLAEVNGWSVYISTATITILFHLSPWRIRINTVCI